MASTTEQQLQSLIRIATRPSPSEALEARLSALHSLSDLLKTPEGAQAVQPRLLALWPLMLQLLGDSQAAIRQSAAPLVGLLGALAVSPRAAQRAPKAGGKPGAPPGLLFDWALPLLGGQQTRPLDLGSQYWMLVALKEGLAAVDDKTLARYAYAVVDVCQQLLESEATSVHILPPLFAVVMQVARHQHALQARFQDLVDLLLGWALDEAFPDNIRHLLADTFASFRPAWQARGPFAQSLVANLAADLAELASWPDSLATTEVRRFVALLSSVAAVVRAAASPEFASFLAGTLPGLVASIKAFHLLVRRDAALLTNPGSFAQEVCRYLDMLVMVAASRMQSVDAARQVGADDKAAARAAHQPAVDMTKAGQHMAQTQTAGTHTASLMAAAGTALPSAAPPGQLEQPISHQSKPGVRPSAVPGRPDAQTYAPAPSDFQLQAAAELPSKAPPGRDLASIYELVLGLLLQLLGDAVPGITAVVPKPSSLAAALQLNLRLLHLMRSKGVAPQPACIAWQLGGTSPLAQLRTSTDAPVVKLLTQTYVSLLTSSDAGAQAAALDSVLTDLEATAVQLQRLTRGSTAPPADAAAAGESVEDAAEAVRPLSDSQSPASGPSLPLDQPAAGKARESRTADSMGEVQAGLPSESSAAASGASEPAGESVAQEDEWPSLAQSAQLSTTVSAQPAKATATLKKQAESSSLAQSAQSSTTVAAAQPAKATATSKKQAESPSLTQLGMLPTIVAAAQLLKATATEAADTTLQEQSAPALSPTAAATSQFPAVGSATAVEGFPGTAAFAEGPAPAPLSTASTSPAQPGTGATTAAQRAPPASGGGAVGEHQVTTPPPSAVGGHQDTAPPLSAGAPSEAATTTTTAGATVDGAATPSAQAAAAADDENAAAPTAAEPAVPDQQMVEALLAFTLGMLQQAVDHAEQAQQAEHASRRQHKAFLEALWQRMLPLCLPQGALSSVAAVWLPALSLERTIAAALNRLEGNDNNLESAALAAQQAHLLRKVLQHSAHSSIQLAALDWLLVDLSLAASNLPVASAGSVVAADIHRIGLGSQGGATAVAADALSCCEPGHDSQASALSSSEAGSGSQAAAQRAAHAPATSAYTPLPLADGMLLALLPLSSATDPAVHSKVAELLHSIVTGVSLAPSPDQQAAIFLAALEQLSAGRQGLLPHFHAILGTLALPVAWAAAGADPGADRKQDQLDPHASWQAELALAPQRCCFVPNQLARLLEFFAQAGPVLLTPGGSRGAADAGWALRLYHSCPLLPELQSEGDDRPITSPVRAAWWAIQEAARHCTAARMRTHFGGPTQSFAALERALQGILARLMPKHKADPGNVTRPLSLEPTWLFQEFMLALEKNIFNAFEGSCLRPAPPSAATAFFAGNRKVCEDWFMRMRPLLMRTAAASEHHQATLHHALARLAELRSQMRILAANAAPAASAPAAAAALGAGTVSAKAHAAAKPPADASSATAGRVVDQAGSTGTGVNTGAADVSAAIVAVPPAKPRDDDGAGAASSSKLKATTTSQPRLLARKAASDDKTSGQVGPSGKAALSTSSAAYAVPAVPAEPAVRLQQRPSAGKQGAKPDRTQAAVPWSQQAAPPPQPELLTKHQQASAQQAKQGGPAAAKAPSRSPAQRMAADVCEALRCAALAMCRLHEPDSIAGLQAYCKHAFTPLQALLDGSPSGGPAAPVGAVALTPVAATSASAAVQTGRGGWGQAQDTVKAENKKGARQFLAGTLAWMDGLRLQAAGSYEAAARQHVQAAEAAAGGRLPAAPEDVAFMTARSCEAYAAVGDWEGLQTWLARLEALKEHSKGDDAAKLPAAAMTPAIDVSNRYLAAASLDRGDLQTAHGLLALSSWDPRLDPGDGGSSAAPGSAKGLFNLEVGEAQLLASLIAVRQHREQQAQHARQVGQQAQQAGQQPQQAGQAQQEQKRQGSRRRRGGRSMSGQQQPADAPAGPALINATPAALSLPHLDTVWANLTQALQVQAPGGLSALVPQLVQLHAFHSIRQHAERAAQEAAAQASPAVPRRPNIIDSAWGVPVQLSREVREATNGGDVSPWLQLLRVHQTLNPDPAGPSSRHAPLVLRIARMATSSGNYGLAGRLLSGLFSVDSMQAVGGAPVNLEMLSGLHASGPTADASRQASGMAIADERWREASVLVEVEKLRTACALGALAEAAAAGQLWNMLLPHASGASAQAPLASSLARSAAFLQLAAWLTPSTASAPARATPTQIGAQPPAAAPPATHIAASLSSPSSQSAIRSILQSPLPGLGISPAHTEAGMQDGDGLHSFRQACLAAAVHAAPASASAWRAYGDWMYSHLSRAGPATHSIPAEQPSSGDAACAGLGSMAALGQSVLAYCKALACGGGAGGGAGSPEDNVAVLLRLIKLLARQPPGSQDHRREHPDRPQRDHHSRPPQHAQQQQQEQLTAGSGQSGDDRGESAIQQLLPYYERGLAEVPAAAWGAVTPQLFAQLLHPDQAVRQLAQRLLEALEMVSPAQVLYPALVEERQALADGHAVGAELATIVADCRRRQPAVVQQLTLMMDEMQRLTVLQAEQWHAILAELQVDVSRRLITLQAEAARCAARAELDTQAKQQIMSDRYATVMAPAALTLQRHMRALQATPPQSPHEQDFQKRFLQPLRAAAEAFTAPDQHSVLRPEAAWKPLQRLASSIGQYISNPSMKLRSISPALQALSDSRIPMPGVDFQAPAHRTATLSSLEAALRSASGSGSGSGSGSADQPPPAGPHQISDGGVVTVAKVDAHVGVLATKTRPKKLRLTGSDGRVYPFLLKGREDLRMDERLMQFLRVANSILRTDPASQLRALHARHFTVTPLGPRTGLIQWLDNTVPLYGVYKAWQKRAATRKAGQAPAAQPGEVAKPGMAANKAPKVLHATELFYSRLVPALEEAGLGRLASRRDWPMDVLKKVLVELMRETPRQLLAREMWAGSASAAGWWAFQRRYSKSTAVMSMVGYLLGLGDRHLDNILLDARTADVVHIDFNIIFDKGLKLSVPEIVPFRLTQTIQAALGLTGVEGAFRSDCEAVLHSLRSQSDTLTGLLEAIVNDPLVDWAVDREHHAARQDMELAVSLNLFTSRMSEMGPRVQHNLQHLASALQTTATLLARFLPLHQDTAHAAQVARTAHEQAQAAQAALTSASNEAASTRSRLARALEATEQLQPQVTSLSAALQPTVRECRVWAERHAHTVGSFQQQTPGELTLPLEYWLSTAASAPLGLATPLGAPGQATGLIMLALNLQPGQAIPLAQGLLSQCAALDKQAAGLFPAQDAGLHGCVAMLQEYTAALRLQAGDYAHSSHHFKWAEACAAVLASPDLQGIARTKGMLSKPLSAQEALGMWAALHAAQQERMRAADELQGALLQPSDTAMEAHADAARSALTEQLQALVGGPAEPLKQAFAAFLTAQSTTLRELQRGQGGAEVAQQAQQAVMGLVSVAVVFNKAGAGATLFDGTTQGAPEPLSWLTTAVEHLRTAASAVAKLQAEVVPQLVGFALHGPTDTMLKDVCALHSCRKEWEQAVVSAQLLARHRQEHAKLLASYDQQVAALSHAMQQADAELANVSVSAGRYADIMQHKAHLYTCMQQLQSAWSHQEATARALRGGAEPIRQRAAACCARFAALVQQGQQQPGPGAAPEAGLDTSRGQSGPGVIHTMVQLVAGLSGWGAADAALAALVSGQQFSDVPAELGPWQFAGFLMRLVDDLLHATFGGAPVPMTQQAPASTPEAAAAAAASLSGQTASLSVGLGGPMEHSSDAQHAAARRSAAGPRQRIRAALQASLDARLRARLLPCLQSLLQATCAAVSLPPPSTSPGTQHGLHTSPGTRHSRSALQTDESGSQAQDTQAASRNNLAAGGASQLSSQLSSASAEPVLVPFSGFDTSLAGADEALEPFSEGASSLIPGQQGGSQGLQGEPPGDGGLVPFTDWDDSLADGLGFEALQTDSERAGEQRPSHGFPAGSMGSQPDGGGLAFGGSPGRAGPGKEGAGLVPFTDFDADLDSASLEPLEAGNGEEASGAAVGASLGAAPFQLGSPLEAEPAHGAFDAALEGASGAALIQFGSLGRGSFLELQGAARSSADSAEAATVQHGMGAAHSSVDSVEASAEQHAMGYAGAGPSVAQQGAGHAGNAGSPVQGATDAAMVFSMDDGGPSWDEPSASASWGPGARATSQATAGRPPPACAEPAVPEQTMAVPPSSQARSGQDNQSPALTPAAAECAGAMQRCAEACGWLGASGLSRGVQAAVAETLKEGQLAGERQLAAFEWLHDADLRQAGVLPAGMNVTPKGLNWALRTRRAELLQRLQHSLAALERVEEAVARWEAASAHLETQLQAAVAAASPQLLARLQHFLSQRGQWLVWAREQAASLSRMARSVLQFEYSREGRMLVGGSQAHDSFAENGNQLQQLDLVLSALAAAEAEMPSAQARLMAVLNDSANASLALDAAQATESRAGAHFASHAPLLVQEARQLSGPLQEACEAIVDSRGSVLRDVGPMLAELRQVTKGHTQASSIQQMAAWALQHHSSLAHSLAPLQAALAGLSSALRPLDLQPYAATAAAAWGLQGKRPGREARAREQAEEEARAEKLALAQAAAVIDVLRVVVPPAERQVSVAPQAAASAEAIRGALTDLTAAASGVAAVIQQEHALEPEADTSATSTAIAATAPASDAAAPADTSQPGLPEARQSAADTAAPATLSAASSQHASGSMPLPVSVSSATVDSSSLDDAASAALSSGVAAVPAAGSSEAAAAAGDVVQTAPPLQQPTAGDSASLPQAAGNPKRKPQRHSSSVQSDRQAFAAGVMRRFGTKLAGRVEEAGGAVRELSVAQQVDLLLRQATSLDLLCQMYEGWTPWI